MMRSVNRTLENINMLKDNLNIKKQTHPEKVSLVRFHSTVLLSPFFLFVFFNAFIAVKSESVKVSRADD